MSVSGHFSGYRANRRVRVGSEHTKSTVVRGPGRHGNPFSSPSSFTRESPEPRQCDSMNTASDCQHKFSGVRKVFRICLYKWEEEF